MNRSRQLVYMYIYNILSSTASYTAKCHHDNYLSDNGDKIITPEYAKPTSQAKPSDPPPATCSRS